MSKSGEHEDGGLAARNEGERPPVTVDGLRPPAPTRRRASASSDPFSDVLRLTVTESVISGGLAAGGTWALRFQAHGSLKFYAVSKGACWLRPEGRKKTPLRLEQGDVFLLHGHGHFVLASSLAATPRDSCPVYDEDGGVLATIGDGSGCALLSGVVRLDPSHASFLTDALPELIHVQGSSPEASALRWLVERIEYERGASLPGANAASAQLAQLIFIQVLRTHLSVAQTVPRGWLRALADERMSRAMHLMHTDPGRTWRLSDLAKAAAMSRASFAARFKSLAGVAPLAYLAEWRMRLAQRRLRDGDASILEIAESLGYTSESAFSHAFKRITGVAPRVFRRAAQQS
jgi:AraC-like DNA-binding protein